MARYFDASQEVSCVIPSPVVWVWRGNLEVEARAIQAGNGHSEHFPQSRNFARLSHPK